MSRQLQLTAACQARLLDTPFPPFSSHLPPQSSSFGSTDGIRTQVSVGPEREGMVAPLPRDTLEYSYQICCSGPRPSVPMPQGTLKAHPALPWDREYRSPAAPPLGPLFLLLGFSHSSEVHESRFCFFGEDRHPRPHLAHTQISGCGFQLLFPRTRSAGPTPVQVKPQKSVILNHHTTW